MLQGVYSVHTASKQKCSARTRLAGVREERLLRAALRRFGPTGPALAPGTAPALRGTDRERALS
jgi:hypothetical protein